MNNQILMAKFSENDWGMHIWLILMKKTVRISKFVLNLFLFRLTCIDETKRNNSSIENTKSKYMCDRHKVALILLKYWSVGCIKTLPLFQEVFVIESIRLETFKFINLSQSWVNFNQILTKNVPIQRCWIKKENNKTTMIWFIY